MQTVKELLVDNADRSRPGLDALAYAYIYLQVSNSLNDQQLAQSIMPGAAVHTGQRHSPVAASRQEHHDNAD